jgi:bacterioferritin-associated ferredoxin
MSQSSVQVDPVLCHCLQVTESQVRDCVTLLGANTIHEIRGHCGAGGGCMACRRRIQQVIDNRATPQRISQP